MQFPDVVTLDLDGKIKNQYVSEDWQAKNVTHTFPYPCICYDRRTNTLVAFCKSKHLKMGTRYLKFYIKVIYSGVYMGAYILALLFFRIKFK